MLQLQSEPYNQLYISRIIKNKIKTNKSIE